MTARELSTTRRFFYANATVVVVVKIVDKNIYIKVRSQRLSDKTEHVDQPVNRTRNGTKS